MTPGLVVLCETTILPLLLLVDERLCYYWSRFLPITLLHSERPKLHTLGLSECNRVKKGHNFERSLSSREANRKSQKLFPFVKMEEKCSNVLNDI